MPTLFLIRRIEAALLFALAIGLLVIGRDITGAEIVLLGLVVLLMWHNLKSQRRQSSEAEFRQVRQGLEALRIEGLRIHSIYKGRELVKPTENISDLAIAAYQTEKLVDKARSILQPYPEFLGIFESHGGNTPADELAGRVRRLQEIDRLVRISHRTGMHRA